MWIYLIEKKEWQKVEFSKEVIEVGKVGPSGKSKGNTIGVGFRYQALNEAIIDVEEDTEFEIQPSSPAKETIRNAVEAKVVERLIVNKSYGVIVRWEEP